MMIQKMASFWEEDSAPCQMMMIQKMTSYLKNFSPSCQMKMNEKTKYLQQKIVNKAISIQNISSTEKSVLS